TGGLRHEQTRVRSRFWYMPVTQAGEQIGQWQVSHSRFSVVLPSVFLTWRPDEAAVVRASLWRSYSRPAMNQLGGGSWLEVDEPGSVTLTQGNPDLKPILATNLDLQYQRLTSRGGWAISAWHKAMEHYMFENGGSYAGAVARPLGGTKIIMPQNGGKARISGLQAEGHWRISPVFDPQSRFEVSASVTRQWSRADLGSADYGRRTVMQSAPDWLASASLSYERGPVRLMLQSRYTGAFLSDYDTLGAPGDWDNQWIRPVLNTDLSGHLRMSPSARIEFGVSNLANALSYEAHVGRHSRVISSRVHTGRQIRLGLRAQL
ncbi:MAG: TonB-dependent receptor domain-containing protein, partial [Asticcacaulis sp.]